MPTTGVYLIDHPPARDQYRRPRRAKPTGLLVLHTAEGVLDAVGPDTSAEQVAAFIAGRSTAGSYHDLVDTDSALQLVPYDAEAYQDATGSNPYALSLSFACRAADWPTMPGPTRAAFMRQAGVAFARQQAWLSAHGHPATILMRVSRAASERGASGLISHAERDPTRRTDPGAAFPWSEFIAACVAAIDTRPRPEPEDDMPTAAEIAAALWDTTVGHDAGGQRVTAARALWRAQSDLVRANYRAVLAARLAHAASVGTAEQVDAALAAIDATVFPSEGSVLGLPPLGP